MVMSNIPPERVEKYERLKVEIIDLVKEFVRKEGGLDMYCLHYALSGAEARLRHLAVKFVDS